MKKVEIYKVEYEISNRPDESWEAYIAGFNSASVTEYLEQFVQNGMVVVNAMTTISRLDSVTNEVREFIAQPLLGEQVNDTPDEIVEEPVVNETKPQKRAIVPRG